MTPLRHLALLLFALALAGVTALVVGLAVYPSTRDWEALRAPVLAAGEQSASGLSVRFLGVSTLLIEDGQHSLLVDGFFSRPSGLRLLLGKFAPDPERIQQGLALAGITHLDAVVTVHSHHDHAMDAPTVAARTGAVLVGSSSTANLARGAGFPMDRMRVVDGTASFAFGDLKVTLVPSQHFPHHELEGDITEPVVPPARVSAYRQGKCFSVLVESRGRSLLVQGSAGFEPGALAGHHADVVFLGIGLLGTRDEAYGQDYWREIVAAVGARRVVPIHWDDFLRGLDRPLVPPPVLLDRVDKAMAFVLAKAAEQGVDVQWPPFAEAFDPLAGLAGKGAGSQAAANQPTPAPQEATSR